MILEVLFLDHLIQGCPTGSHQGVKLQPGCCSPGTPSTLCFLPLELREHEAIGLADSAWHGEGVGGQMPTQLKAGGGVPSTPVCSVTKHKAHMASNQGQGGELRLQPPTTQKLGTPDLVWSEEFFKQPAFSLSHHCTVYYLPSSYLPRQGSPHFDGARVACNVLWLPLR